MTVLKDLWEDKPLFITVVVGILGLLYILYKSNHANVMAPVPADTGTSTGAGSVAPGTFVEESYYNNVSTTTTNTNPPHPPQWTHGPSPVPIPVPVLPTIIKPVPKGSLKGKPGSAGKGDTNFWVYTVPAGATIMSVNEFAKWGTNWHLLLNYRNNKQILEAAGVNTANPYALIPTGLKLSV